MFDIQYIKDQYCKYKCNAKAIDVDAYVSDSFWCEECQEYKDTYIETRVKLTDEVCQLCQIDNFIKELEDFKSVILSILGRGVI